jgi:hypothetical protein
MAKKSKAKKKKARRKKKTPARKKLAARKKTTVRKKKSARKKAVKRRLERELNEGLLETFPASDPVAVTEPGVDGPDEK